MTSPADHEARVLAWRRARLARLTAPDGWLSLAGKFWLHEGDNLAGSAEHCEVLLPEGKAPAELGVFCLQHGAVTFRPLVRDAAATSIFRANDPQPVHVDRAIVLGTDVRGAPDRVAYGSLRCEIMQRDAGFAVRVRDLESKNRADFPGLEYFPIDHAAQVLARLVPYQPMKDVDLAYEDGRSERSRSPGVLLFELHGRELSVDPIIEDGGKRLLIVFRDGTNRDESYGAGRFLYAPWSAAGPLPTHVQLDFNQAFNPPCAFTPYALCPLAPAQNELPVRIEAGEKKPVEHGAL